MSKAAPSERLKYILSRIYAIVGELRILACTRCPHTWPSRLDYEPKKCPRCKSQYWNKPRIRGVK